MSSISGRLPYRPLRGEPHCLFLAAEVRRRANPAGFLDKCGEDWLIEGVLLPLFLRLGFHRAVQPGAEICCWSTARASGCVSMLPTRRLLRFGIQVRRGN